MTMIDENNMTYVGPYMAKTHEENIDNIVIELIDAYGKDIKVLKAEYISRSESDPDLARLNAEANFLYAYKRIMRRGFESRTKPERKEKRVAAINEISRTMKRKMQEVCIMDLILPSGKTVRDSTFAECKKAGGFLGFLATKGKPSQIVGKVFNDEQVQKFWKGVRK